MRIVNVVATADLKQSVDLEKAGKLPYCAYDITVYRCVYVKSPSNMHSKVSVFTTGKMISYGTKSEKEAKEDLRFVAGHLAKAGLVGSMKVAVEVRNIVASVEFRNPIHLEEVAMRIPHIIYEPEQFPGAMYHPPDLMGVSILLFASGKAVIAGARSLHQLRLAAGELERIAKVFESRVLAT